MLLHNDDTILFAVFAHTSRIFTLGLPGVYVLIPAYIKCIEQLSVRNDIPNQVTEACLTIISSIIPLEARYATQKYTDFTDYAPNPDEKAEKLFVNMKYGVLKIIKSFLTVHVALKNYQYCEQLLWDCSNLLFTQLLLNDNEDLFVSESLILLLDFMSNKNTLVACAAIDGITLLVHDKSHHQRHQIFGICHTVIDRICWSISSQIPNKGEKFAGRETVIFCIFILTNISAI